MDRIIYTAMNGAARITEHQAALSNNMANVNTPGFREQIALYRSVPVNDGVSLPTRVSTVASTPRNNFEMGNMQTTGRDLDVALASSNGWIAVQTPQGEAYTRAGSLQVGVNGLLQTSLGQPVMSDQNGIIDVPDQAALTITSDGTITAIGAGDAPNNILNLGRIKLANPPEAQLVHGDDGVFRLAPVNGQPAPPAPADPSLRVLSGVLEGSNTNPMAAMVGMIENARRFEQQMQVVQQADRNAERANGILSVS
ncbi:MULTISPECIES: flagellar basal body rod protein FlgF [Achromobacter]|jgi:flagellar basal-body rod protein FlgF|uniref:Flagellar basal-body rod protein FlgF n=4 Tax=Achromobacter TaxID=222 RepID=A0A7T4B1T3_9BURK|nr:MULTISPECIES: flagellar basal body rod protein FlgF [Achromobacter]AUZ18011.1 flagellar basal body rod protein FlgF [Achromobacter xylosoxidans]MBB1624479.1 flagellar biosynthesis protein FlgF [Achromobacter sp. UMC71]MBN9641917.1 flagellar basal body rod protein FlgF [Achromobacter sp.]MCG2599536.1 flagellar basal body rod protein FlgF [Achromobacter sp.]MCG2604019.1 flagellar basal body rod protein FlgF [Achromobacter sp.]